MVWAASERGKARALFFSLTYLILLCPDPGWAEPGTAIEQPGKRNEQTVGKYKEGELLVKFKAETPKDVESALHGKLGSEVIKEFHTIKVQHVRLKKRLSVEEAVRLYQADPNVEYAEPNHIVEIQE
jgi:hypothetical protein